MNDVSFVAAFGTPEDRPRQVGARKRAALERARHEARRRLATRALLLVGALVVGTLGVFAFRGGGVDSASSTWRPGTRT